jgi:hypothetical protein
MKKQAHLVKCPKLNKAANPRYLVLVGLTMTKTMGSAVEEADGSNVL